MLLVVHNSALMLFLLIFFLQVEYVKLLNRYTEKSSALGTLYLTATHLIYVEQTNSTRKETWVM